MEKVVVSVLTGGSPAERDLELPAELGGRQLAALIAEALGLPDAGSTSYGIELTLLGRTLGDGESLADAGAWDGSILTVRGGASPWLGPSRVPTASSQGVTAPSPADPIRGWRPLGADVLPSSPSPAPPDDPNSKYVWKRIDD